MKPHRTRSLSAQALSLGCTALLLGCAQQKQQAARVIVRAESDPGVQLQNVAIMHAGASIGESDAAGVLPVSLAGPIGETVRLEVRCPTGYRALTTELQVVIRPNEDSARLPEYRVQCRPERRSLVVSLRATNGVHIPVRYLGKAIAHTDEQGVAHGLLQLPAGEHAQLLLDTSAPEHRYLRPQNPVLSVSVPDRDDIVSVEQAFSIHAPKRPAPPIQQLPVHF